MIQKFRKINTMDRDLSLIQDNVSNTFNPITRIPILDGQLLTAIELGTASQRIEHTLGRKPLGYIVVMLNQDATVFGTESDSRLITLSASANNTTCNLWIF